MRAILSGTTCEGKKTQVRLPVDKLLWPTPNNASDLEEFHYNPKWIAIAQRDPIYGFLVDGETEAECCAALASFCPLGHPGDSLWVRESAIILPVSKSAGTGSVHTDGDGAVRRVIHTATLTSAELKAHRSSGLRRSPSQHLPRWAARLILEIEGVRVQRVQDLTTDEILAEGICVSTDSQPKYGHLTWPQNEWQVDPKLAWKRLWAERYGNGPWEANAYVWAIEFNRTYSTQASKQCAEERR